MYQDWSGQLVYSNNVISKWGIPPPKLSACTDSCAGRVHVSAFGSTCSQHKLPTALRLWSPSDPGISSASIVHLGICYTIYYMIQYFWNCQLIWNLRLTTLGTSSRWRDAINHVHDLGQLADLALCAAKRPQGRSAALVEYFAHLWCRLFEFGIAWYYLPGLTATSFGM